ncbi:MAG: SAF domain-containing protein [Actinomycetota bacterium]
MRTVAQRRGALVGVGVALVAIGALAFLYVSGQLSTATPVIAVTADVQRGAVITADDVGVANAVPDSALAPLPAERIDDVTGLRAASDLVAGSLLTEASVTASVVPAAGEAVVGVALGPAQVPGEPLLPGDVVLVVDTPRSGDEPPAEAPAAIEATVLKTYPPTGPSDPLVVDVVVSDDQAADLAARVATGRVGVVLMSRER